MKRRKPKYVHEYVDRHGKSRVYLRMPGRPRIVLPTPLYSEAFWTAYHKALEGETMPVGANRTKPGSMSALLAEYYASAKFTTLADATKRSYRSVLEGFRAEYGNDLVAQLEPVHIERILDGMASTPAQANVLRKRLNMLMKFAVKRGYRRDNPVSHVDKLLHVEKGFRTWTEDNIAAFRKRWMVGTPQRLAFEILLFTGLRRADAVKLGRQHMNGDHFVIRTSKSRGATRLEIPIHPTLCQHLSYAPTDALAFTATRYGRVRSEKAFTNWIREAARQAGLPSDSSPHGLRKAACRRLAEMGCTPHQIMAITGHKNLSEVETYTRAVEQKRLAGTAMASVIDDWNETEGGTENG